MARVKTAAPREHKTQGTTQGTRDDVLALARPQERPIFEALHALITHLDRAAVERVWPRQKIASYGVGPKKMSQHYAYIAVQPSHINLGFYRGTSLPDPQGLLEGTGQQLRHVKLRNLAATHKPALAALLRAAIDERRKSVGEC